MFTVIRWGRHGNPTWGRPAFQAERGEEHHAQHWAPGEASGKVRQGDCQQAVWPPSPWRCYWRCRRKKTPAKWKFIYQMELLALALFVLKSRVSESCNVTQFWLHALRRKEVFAPRVERLVCLFLCLPNSHTQTTYCNTSLRNKGLDNHLLLPSNRTVQDWREWYSGQSEFRYLDSS